MKDLISIIVPVYNVEQYVGKCLDSLINQIYKNIEVIVIDDGSTDKSGEICDQYALKDSRIKIIHKQNGGLSSARNVGIINSKGEYLSFVDSDDYVDVDFISNLYNSCLDNDCQLSICRYHIVNSTSSNRCILPEENRKYSKKEAMQLLLDGKIESFAWNKLYKSEIFDNIIFPQGKSFEDIYIMHCIFEKCDNIYISSNTAYYYIWRNDSIMHKYSITNTHDNYFALKTRFDFFNGDEYDLSGLVAQIVKVRLYLELVISKVSQSEIKKYLSYIKNVNSDFSKISVSPKILSKLSSNEILKYKVFKKNKLIYKLLIGNLYEGKYRKYAEMASGYFRNSNLVEKFHRKHSKAIWLIGLPEYNNYGDCAIGLASLDFLNNHIKNSDLFYISEEIIKYSFRKVSKQIKENDLIILQGGGNISDLYSDQQNIRKKVLKYFRNNKIIIFPQTIYFSKSSTGQHELMKTVSLFDKCSDLTLFCREPISYKKAKKYFNNTDIVLVPDIVFSLNTKDISTNKRCGVLCCLRNDIEKTWAQDKMYEIKEILLNHFDTIKFTDTISETAIHINDYKKKINDKLQEFANSQLVITDRLHGLLFSYITNTPCIAIDNINHKIEGIYYWMKDVSYINFVLDFTEFKNIMNPSSRFLNKCGQDIINYNNEFAPLIDYLNNYERKL